jgi:hypothetical protein
MEVLEEGLPQLRDLVVGEVEVNQLREGEGGKALESGSGQVEVPQLLLVLELILGVQPQFVSAQVQPNEVRHIPKIIKIKTVHI